MATSTEDYEEDFDTDTGEEQSVNSHRLPNAVKDLGSTDQLLLSKHTRMNEKHKGQRGVARRRSSVSKKEKEKENTEAKEAKKKLEAYKRANERLKGELDKCIDSQFRVRELEDQLKNKREEMRKLVHENGRLEKMLDKPTKDPVEVDNGHVDRIRTLMNDMRLLQEKTRKYKSRAMDAERNVQKLTVQLGELQNKNDKMLVLLKEVKKDGMDSKEKKDLEAKLAMNEQKAKNLARELQMSKKKHATELKRFKSEALAANQEVERLREKAEKSDSQLKEVQMEARILHLKLRNEKRSQKQKVRKVKPLDLPNTSPSQPTVTTQRTSETMSSKEPEPVEMSFLERSVLAGLPSSNQKELLRIEPSPPVLESPRQPSEAPTSSRSPRVLLDDNSELQAKMDALKQRQAQVAANEEAKAAQRQAEMEQLEAERREHEKLETGFLERSAMTGIADPNSLLSQDEAMQARNAESAAAANKILQPFEQQEAAHQKPVQEEHEAAQEILPPAQEAETQDPGNHDQEEEDPAQKSQDKEIQGGVIQEEEEEEDEEEDDEYGDDYEPESPLKTHITIVTQPQSAPPEESTKTPTSERAASVTGEELAPKEPENQAVKESSEGAEPSPPEAAGSSLNEPTAEAGQSQPPSNQITPRPDMGNVQKKIPSKPNFGGPKKKKKW